MNTKIIAILMAGIVAMAVGMPMAFGAPAVPDTSATVNNKAPTIEVGSISDFAPDACSVAATTTFHVTGKVNDDNGKADIVSVAYNLKNTSTSTSITTGSATLTDFNTTAKSFDAAISVDCCIAAGNYSVYLTVTDSATTPNTYDFGPYYVNILSTNALSINFDKVTFEGEPGQLDRPGSALLGATPVGAPKIKSEGNGPLDVGILASNLLKDGTGPDTITGDKMEASVGAVWKNVGAKKTWDIGLGCEVSTGTGFRLDLIPVPIKAGAYTGQLTISVE